MSGVWVVSARAGRVDADARAELATRLADHPGVLLQTCHRVELYGSGPAGMADGPLGGLPDGSRLMVGRAAADHVVEVALGLDSVVVAEDQVLFQLRSALDAARRRGHLDPPLERLLDVALRAGRKGRSWLPGRRPTLADLALGIVPGIADGAPVLVVGAGSMGELVARTAAAHKADVAVSSRTRDRAAAVAQRLGVGTAAFDPGPAAIGRYGTIVVALAGAWPVGAATLEAISVGNAHLVDLSSPPAIPAPLRTELGSRYHSIDQLVDVAGEGPADALVRRLRGLASESVDTYEEWLARQGHRDAARQVTERAERIRDRELAELWRRSPGLPEEQRLQIEGMTERLVARLMREPLERLGRDADGDAERAARELFGL